MLNIDVLVNKLLEFGIYQVVVRCIIWLNVLCIIVMNYDRKVEARYMQ